MFSSPLLPLPKGLEIATIETVDDLLVVHVVSTKVKVSCPLCFCLAKRRHSRYTRVVADLPCAGFRVQLRLQMRKFFCDNAACSRKIFTERVPAFVEPWAQTTVRLRQALQAVGTATCGELGTRLATHLGIRTSATTILRRIMALPSAPVEAVSYLGIDDFALLRVLTPEYNCARIKLTVPRTGCTLCELKFSSHTGGSHDQEQDSEYNTRIVSAREVHSRHRHHPGNSQEYGAQVSAPSGTGGHASSAT